MTQLICSTAPSVRDESFVPATLDFVSRCPARRDYVEFNFSTPEGRWTWCVAEPDDPDEQAVRRARRGGTLAVTVGRYGAQAHVLTARGPGKALPSEVALPLILAGADVMVARRLIVAERR